MLVDSSKGICFLIVVTTGIIGFIAWLWEGPGPITWCLRIGCSVLFVLSLVGLIWLSSLQDPAPDYLKQAVGQAFYDQDGFCFAFAASVIEGVCYLEAYFQNRYDRPLIGRIAMRPTGRLFGKEDFEAVTYQIECAPAAFGIARIPLPIPKSVQGEKQRFEVGASVEHPEGRGKWMRYTNGLPVQKGADFSGGGFVTGLSVAGALAGMLVLRLPDAVSVSLPTGVAEKVPEGRSPEIVTFWKLGDPPLKAGELNRFDKGQHLGVLGCAAGLLC